VGHEALSTSLEAAGLPLNSAGGRRSRRSWSDEDKQRIVEESVVPGASVADIARRHGVNANLVFNWRKAARAAAAEGGASDACTPGDGRVGAAEACAFIPLGVLGHAADDASALMVGSSAAVVSETSSRRTGLPRPGMEERPGVIEIDLADGVRLRVDAFVNERALRRVLAVLKVTS
jgi:transposase